VAGFAGLATVGAALAVLAAGCGSSSSSSSASSSVNASNTASGASANVSQAQQIVAQAMKRPTSISVIKPIGKPVPTGKKIVFTTAALRAEIQAQIPQLEAKHIVISDASSTDPVAPPFIYNTSTTAQNGRIGSDLAAEIIANSDGKANTLYVNLPAYTILSTLGASFEQVYKQLCSSCGYASIDVALTQIPNAPSLIVSYLRSHPSVNYVALSVPDALDNGLPAALAAAGLSHVKIVGEGGGPTDFSYLANGQELALVPFDYYASDSQMVDALARHFAGVPVQLTALPLWMITKSNLPSNYTQLFPNVLNYQSQFPNPMYLPPTCS